MSKLQDALVPFQREDVDHFVKYPRGFLAHKTGLGKTVIVLATRERLFNGAPHKLLVVGSSSAAATWDGLMPRWTDEQPILVEGQAFERNKIWNQAEQAKHGTWVCTYDAYRIDIAGKRLRLHNWDMVIMDEIHKIKNRRTKRYEGMLPIRSEYLLGMSASIVDRGPQDIWAFLHLIDRKRFSSYWAFVGKYCHIVDSGFGNEIIGVKNQEDLRKLLSTLGVRRTWEDVGMQLPGLRRTPVICNMTKQQAVYYETLQDELLLAQDDAEENGIIAVPNKLTLTMRLRQLAVCPRILGLNDDGGMIEHIIESLDDDPHTVIFTPFAAAFEHFERCLNKAGYKDVYSIRGGLRAAELNGRIARWKSSRGIMLCTVLFAESFALDTVHRAFFAGFEWSPEQNAQAEGRLRRLDSNLPNGVTCEYLIPRNSIYDYVREIINGKSYIASQVLRLMRGQAGGQSSDY